MRVIGISFLRRLASQRTRIFLVLAIVMVSFSIFVLAFVRHFDLDGRGRPAIILRSNLFKAPLRVFSKQPSRVVMPFLCLVSLCRVVIGLTFTIRLLPRAGEREAPACAVIVLVFTKLVDSGLYVCHSRCHNRTITICICILCTDRFCLLL